MGVDGLVAAKGCQHELLMIPSELCNKVGFWRTSNIENASVNVDKNTIFVSVMTTSQLGSFHQPKID